VNFEADKLTVLQGETVTFTDHTTGIPETWKWEFIHESQGVLYSSTTQNPVIRFDVPGKYHVKLKAANPGHSGEKTIEQFIEVIDITYVLADFTATGTATYTGGSITFDDISLGTVGSRTWAFEGGSPATSTAKNPTVTYSAPGRYKVKLTVSNTAKSSDKEISQYILVIPGNDLMAFLPFNNATADAGPLRMGVAVQGTIGFLQADRNNITGNTASFDGASGIVLQSQGVLNLGTADFSISGWVKASSTARMMLWQESGKNGSGDNQSWLRMGDNTTDRQLRFNTEEPGGSSILNMGAEGKLSDNQWKHFVCVRKGTNMSVYINGVKAKELTTPVVRNITGAQNFKIGFQEGVSSFSSFFNGQMDDFMIYKRALTATEILELYTL
jgi:PKD repeat protein